MYEGSCRLYLISPPSINVPDFSEQLKQAFDGGDVGAFQLRLKNVSDEEILKVAELLRPICAQCEVAFIINDRADIAAKIGADGVHLGQDDGSIISARKLLGDDAVIGISCHDSKHLAMVAGEEGADYVAFGAFYPTNSKSPEDLAKYGTPDPEILSWWQEYMLLPCVAIGGINPQNCSSLIKAGADFIAVIQAVWNHPVSPQKAVAEFNEVIKKAKNYEN
ncbi:MAG: thiamine phosphate synthase [Rickettsiales bacterium]